MAREAFTSRSLWSEKFSENTLGRWGWWAALEVNFVITDQLDHVRQDGGHVVDLIGLEID